MKFIIKWNVGYGDSCTVIEADNEEMAERAAYEAWRDDAESQADYEAMEYTDDLAMEYDLKD